ncbi:type II toxin-antitoxin system RelE/ParE family toxin [Brenneria corticis]|uniref:Diaminopimelate decarboxylase n=1 Tax=Brenneria corticis TaxID=2173106 RepID=A0A2U1U7U7_9GAMM|nr:type II toxin-antitoxin system RelE/ParE family toxin [Brenneria sp. CFCC 11842]PWC17719.1 diaminopimelate decarboxylase [Brenneria sp. CFCC 11842]
MWTIETTDTFDHWFDGLDDADRINVLAYIMVLREKGPMLTRPYADSVNGSRHRNMKELRVQSQGDPIRVFFAFDPRRRGILLCGGNKTANEKRFYTVTIPIADREFSAHLAKLKKSGE